VLVTHDLLGFTTGYVPRFAKAYAELKDEITRAVTRYREDVTKGTFPGADNVLR
jgi:3-methyl-2-oxobutanoate hydroxymethyltransferase